METLFIALRVLVVLGVIVGVLWFVQRRVTKGRPGGRARRGNAVTVVGRQGVGPKASVVVVDVDGNRFVLGVTERQVSVLHTGERPQDADVTPLVPVRRTFAKELPDRAAANGTDDTARTDGTAGRAGTVGRAGTAGTDGTVGRAGTAGTDGTVGRSGTAGTDGTAGADARHVSTNRSATADSRQDADFLTAQGRASVFDEALKGSILSPATWRQAGLAVRPRK